MEGGAANGYGISSGGWWKCSEIDYGGGCTALNTLKAIEFYTVNGWTIWYVSFISVKLFLKDIWQQ